MFGGVDAVFGVTESQRRGTLHLHAFVWVLREWQASDLVSAVRRRYYGAGGLRDQFLRWVEWVSHESVATLPAKLGAPAPDADTAHLGPSRRDDAAADDEAAPSAEAAAEDAAETRWRDRSGRDVTQPLTGATASRLGPFEKPPGFYCPAANADADATSAATAAAGDAVSADEVEALTWAEASLDDARDVAADMGVHGCRQGCWARRRGVGVVCRHGF